MKNKKPGINIDILITQNNKILLGVLSEKWSDKNTEWYGVPGRDIRFGEKIGDTVKRNIKEEFGCNVTSYKIICVNANYALGNHYIGIGVVAQMDGEPNRLLAEDWKKWEWFDIDTIPQNLFPATQNLIACYIKGKVNVSE